MTFAYATVTVGTTFKTTLSQYERQLKLGGMVMSLLVILVCMMGVASSTGRALCFLSIMHDIMFPVYMISICYLYDIEVMPLLLHIIWG